MLVEVANSHLLRNLVSFFEREAPGCTSCQKTKFFGNVTAWKSHDARRVDCTSVEVFGTLITVISCYVSAMITASFDKQTFETD